MNNKKRITIFIGIIIVALSIWIGPILFKEIDYAMKTPDEKKKIEIETNKKIECSFTAYDRFIDDWNKECKAQNLHNECELKTNMMDELLNRLSKETQECESELIQP